ncbi:M20 family metallopeptidase [Paenibacillus sp. YIM B09110]|uniref:M20 family metallopeptidase n=1 Tax=Paenibacillus sp. YIM B09110 TaxID=3126102 RepID=UPI00301E29F5
MELTKQISELIDSKKDLFIRVSDQIWDNPETSFQETRSSQIVCEALEEEGFKVQKGVGGLDTGFVADYGSGKPVIAILGEFDALANLSQRAGSASYEPLVPGGNGHGCGHNLLGAGSLAAAVAVKDYIKLHGLTGTVRYYGCPAEETGSGKAFMAKAGLFADVDSAFCWHPASSNGVMHMSSLANVHVYFRFKGRSAHAGATPHLGRSALDAVELMNVGVNYLREHMIDQARIHYAITNSGGHSPNVVQAEAEVVYLIRAPKSEQVSELFERVKNIAKGAALMTETSTEFIVEGATSNLIPNVTLEKAMHGHLSALGVPVYTEEEESFAKAIYASIPQEDISFAAKQVGKSAAAYLSEHPLSATIMPYAEHMVVMPASTDVADVSWNVPTAQCVTATWTYGTPIHAWQTVAQGKTSYAHKGMLLAGKTMASTAVEALLRPELITEAKKELAARLDGESYVSPIPAGVEPPKAYAV